MAEIQITLQQKQREFLNQVRQTPVTFYGGAKGGGKSYALRNILLILLGENKNAKALLIRKTYDELVANHIEMLFRENPVLFEMYNKGEKTLYLPNGSLLRFRHLQHPSDVYNYQGQEYDFIGIDELTQHTKEIFTILRSSNRTTNPKIKPRMLLTGNPGGIGHGWVRKLFIVGDLEERETKEDYTFIPAKVYDNDVLISNDPDYLKRLEALPEDLREAYLNGNWDVFKGQFFREWDRDIHVITPFELYPQWTRYITIDYGYSAPSAVLWCAVDYSGRVIVYRELYEKELTFTQLARKIVEMTPQEEFQANGTTYNERKNIKYIAYDPSLQARSSESGVSGDEILRQTLRDGGLSAPLIPANNNRKYGWGIMREFLAIRPDAIKGDTAGIVFFNTCLNSIRTIPEQIYDATHLEELDTDGEDHLADSIRYGLVTLRIQKSSSDYTPKEELSIGEKTFQIKLKNRKKGIRDRRGKYV